MDIKKTITTEQLIAYSMYAKPHRFENYFPADTLYGRGRIKSNHEYEVWFSGEFKNKEGTECVRVILRIEEESMWIMDLRKEDFEALQEK